MCKQKDTFRGILGTSSTKVPHLHELLLSAAGLVVGQSGKGAGLIPNTELTIHEKFTSPQLRQAEHCSTMQRPFACNKIIWNTEAVRPCR